jgi:primosomal protein N' (replication factor Y)
MIRSELAERVEISLPPTVTSFVISGPVGEFSILTAGIRKAISDKRLAASVKIYGPIEIALSQAKLVMYCHTQDTNSVTTFLHELARRRSIAKKEYLSIRINPYSL